METNIERGLKYIADAIESGYSSVFTFGVKEILNTEERRLVAQSIRELTITQSSDSDELHKVFHR